MIRNFYESGRPTSAVCHAPAVLTDVKLSSGKYLLDGLSATAFSNAEEEQAGLTKAIPWLVESRMAERGAKFEKADKAWGEHVVVDTKDGKTLITGQNPASAGPLAKALIKALKA